MTIKLHCNISNLHNKRPCYICPLAKQRKLSFVSHNNMSSSPFDLIHCDIWGPYLEMAYLGYRFFVTLFDDCTCFTGFIFSNINVMLVSYSKFFQHG